MIDFSKIILCILHIYAKIIYSLHNVKSVFYTKKYTIFDISNVYCISNNKNIKYDFVTKKLKTLSPINDIYCFEWVFDNITYKQYLCQNTLHYLVPYTFNDMRNPVCDHKIIACILHHNNTQKVENITMHIRQIAGPKQNFYKNIYNIHTRDIFGIKDSNLQIITTKAKYDFDLSKDNILEL